jgi:hypothetical protein
MAGVTKNAQAAKHPTNNPTKRFLFIGFIINYYAVKYKVIQLVVSHTASYTKLMQNKSQLYTVASFLIGVLIGGAAMYAWQVSQHDHSDPNSHHDNHPIADPYDSEYHVHADFHIVVQDNLVDLSDDMFQTTSMQSFHPDAHLHNNNGDVKHIHDQDITFADFLGSLSITLTDNCLTLDNEYCSGETEEVLLYVNGELYTSPITTYVPVDDDRILLYYGEATNTMIATYLENIPDDSCYYSGTCPERGVAPDEECGLTCEL